MEKHSPHCKLPIVKALIAEGKVRITGTALCHGEELGFDWDGIVDVAMALAPKDFYKSMTTHADHRVWQDVYRPMTKAGRIYMKLTVVADVLIVSFKEL